MGVIRVHYTPMKITVALLGLFALALVTYAIYARDNAALSHAEEIHACMAYAKLDAPTCEALYAGTRSRPAEWARYSGK